MLFMMLFACFLKKMLFIFSQYQHKKEIMARLFELCAQHGYDPRFFRHYMDTLCMKRVVYLVLKELSLEQEYEKLKRSSSCEDAEYDQPLIMSCNFEDGKLVFNVNTEIEERLNEM